ncbi:response regulator transcription factor [Luteococcus peritonei]|uniref:Response regulator transcription factor n=1 Tax=Luteococcus peritonei TaxID=88874 RepID=A0ABW4RTK3_9ACTN
MITVMLADDQGLVRGALAALLTLEGDIDVVAQVGRGDEVLAAAQAHRPDVVLMDVDMPGMDGLAAAAQLLRELPRTRVLIVTTYGRPGFLKRAMSSGAHGFIVKDTPSDELAEAVRRVHAGLRVVDPALAADSLVFGDSPLTARETEVLQAAADGATVAEVARRVHLSEGTVRNHLSQAMAKTGAATRAEAVHIAAERGWVVA